MKAKITYLFENMSGDYAKFWVNPETKTVSPVVGDHHDDLPAGVSNPFEEGWARAGYSLVTDFYYLQAKSEVLIQQALKLLLRTYYDKPVSAVWEVIGRDVNHVLKYAEMDLRKIKEFIRQPITESLTPKVIKNPKAEHLMRMLAKSKRKELRGYYHEHDMYFWDAFEGIHKSVVVQLGIPYDYLNRMYVSDYETGEVLLWDDGVPTEDVLRRYGKHGDITASQTFTFDVLSPRTADRLNEAKGGTTVLYRGDSGKIEKFEVSKTDEHALFGRGIYLTDNLEVAKDYTIKAGHQDVILRGDGHGGQITDRGQLLASYIRKLCNDEFNLKTDIDNLGIEFRSKTWAYHDDVARPDGMSPEEMNAWNDEFRARREQASATMRKDFEKRKKLLIQKAVAKAKALFKTQSKNLRAMELTTGEWIMVKPDRVSAISVFEIPNDYLAKCLHGEQPLTDEALKVLKQAWRLAHKYQDDAEEVYDLRTGRYGHGDEHQGLSFDKFVANYKKHGTRYSWTDDHRGGKGKNPTLDELINGTHSGYYTMREAGDFLMQEFKKLGYVGIEYQGGVRGAGTGNRGGGGQEHTAYALWDDKSLAQWRKPNAHYTDLDIDSDSVKGMRSSRIR